MQGMHPPLSCQDIDHFQEDHKQEKLTQEQEALTRAKRHEDHAQKCDQAAKAAQCDPLKVKPIQAQQASLNIPGVIDKAVTYFSSKYILSTEPHLV